MAHNGKLHQMGIKSVEILPYFFSGSFTYMMELRCVNSLAHSTLYTVTIKAV